MRKQIYALIIALLPAMILAQTFEIKYNFSDFTVTQGADSVVTISTVHRSLFSGDMQSPRLPFLSANILCSQGTVECDPVFRYEKEPIATGVLLHTIPPVYPTSIDPSTIDYTPQIARTSQSTPYNYAGVGKMMGYSFAQISLSPFEYDYDTRTLYFIKSFVITLNERVQQRALSKSGIATTPEPLGDPQVVAPLVMNSAEIETIYPQQSEMSKAPSFNLNDHGTLLIITSDELKKDFNSYIEWKKLKGVKVFIETVEDICRNYAEETIQLSIKRCIKYYYDYCGANYVLLGGGDNIVPAQMSYMVLKSNPSGDTLGPSDLYYACLDDETSGYSFDWDGNGNKIYAELNDNIDLYPEVYLSRIPIKSSYELCAYLNKVLKYEMTPCMDDSFYKFLFGGCVSHAYLTSVHSDTYIYGAQIYDHFLLSMPNYRIDTMFDTFHRNSDGSLNPPLTKDNLAAEINKSYNMIYIGGHGSAISWCTKYVLEDTVKSKESFYVSEAFNLTNQYPSIVVTSACLTAAFDNWNKNNSKIYYTDCLAEAFIKNSNSGAIAYFGFSRDGVKAGIERLSGNLLMADGFFENLLVNTQNAYRRFGRVAQLAKVYASSSYNDYNLNRWNLLSVNSFGDPDLDILLNVPKQLDVTVENDNNGGFRVNIGNVPTATLVCMSTNDMGKSFYYKTNIYKGSEVTVYPTVPCVKLAITCPDYIPYLMDLSSYKIEGDPVIGESNRMYIENLSEEYTVKWSLGNRNLSNANKIRNIILDDSINVRPDNPIISPDIPGMNDVIYIEQNSEDSHECYVKEGMSMVADGENYEVTLYATIFKDGKEVGVLQKDIIRILNFYLEVSQEPYDNYPGISSFSVSDNCYTVSTGDEWDEIWFSKAKTKATRPAQNTVDPIYVYKKGRVILTSPIFKYCTELEPYYLSPDYFNYDSTAGVIELEMPTNDDLNLSMDLNLYFGDNYQKRTLCLVQVETDEPSIVIIRSLVLETKVGFRIPESVTRKNWKFDIYDINTGALKHSETGNLYNNTYTIEFFSIGGNYILKASNEVAGMVLTTKFSPLPF